jgi:hypothetical protein
MYARPALIEKLAQGSSRNCWKSPLTASDEHRHPHAASPLIRLHANDNVLVAKTAAVAGPGCPSWRAAARAGAGRAQDRRLRIAQGEPVRKYER